MQQHDWLQQPAQALNQQMRQQAQEYQNSLTKPAGSLGELERIGIQFSAMQGALKPQLTQVAISVFAADHGVAEEGVSAFPQAVTAEMVRNFAHGGAAICVLARGLDAQFEVVNLGTVVELEPLPNVIDCRIAPASGNFCHSAAMTPAQFQQALSAGRDAAERAKAQQAELFIGGEMGIANTTSAAALGAALLQRPAADLVGPGTGISPLQINHKTDVIDRAIRQHAPAQDNPVELLRCLGGFEIAALSAAYIRCAQLAIPVLVDGFICTVAALYACRINQQLRDWLLFSHNSAEPGHRLLQQALEAEPLLDLGMRLGEGSGAAIAVPLLQSACALQAQMATFAEASVSDKEADKQSENP